MLWRNTPLSFVYFFSIWHFISCPNNFWLFKKTKFHKCMRKHMKVLFPLYLASIRTFLYIFSGIHLRNWLFINYRRILSSINSWFTKLLVIIFAITLMTYCTWSSTFVVLRAFTIFNLKLFWNVKPILYSQTYRNKTKCMVMMSIKSSAKIVKLMTLGWGTSPKIGPMAFIWEQEAYRAWRSPE